MEVPNGKNNKVLVCAYEMMGTAMLQLGINWAGNVGSLKPVGISMTLFAAIMLFGHVSGAHFNPAVTMGVLIKEYKMENILFALMIMASQIGGAFLGELMMFIGLNQKTTNNMNILCPAAGGYTCESGNFKQSSQVFLVEMFATCGLVTTIITLKYHSTIREGVLAALTVGLTLLAMICWSGGISGGCLNPAIGIANSIVQFALKDEPNFVGSKLYANLTLSSLPIYIFAPLMGGVIAGVFQLFNGKVAKIFKEEEPQAKMADIML